MCRFQTSRFVLVAKAFITIESMHFIDDTGQSGHKHLLPQIKINIKTDPRVGFDKPPM
ncbi:hypothetical protein HZY62_05305 [Maribacter polysiphoniae]|uniref:Uncharacterized protein n=1 Tax=Maribacter polysiphoniae TaxID=429344 RepID=A0A316E9N2_9FLAO|nr:hypothetical protein [Maribacter polysiphoniae]MBD1259996.1 hypothetical protein [Maribacter polysiphoniae]PWK25453.1 hypothetical protein LX92_00192 [Maribacter polysiphoniae]